MIDTTARALGGIWASTLVLVVAAMFVGRGAAMSPIRALVLQAPLVAAALLALQLARQTRRERSVWVWIGVGLVAAVASGVLLRLFSSADGPLGRSLGFLLAAGVASSFASAVLVSLRRRRVRLGLAWALDAAVALSGGVTLAVVLNEAISRGAEPSWPVVLATAIAAAVTLFLTQLVAAGVARDPFLVGLSVALGVYQVVLIDQHLAVRHGSAWPSTWWLDPAWPALVMGAVLAVLAWRSQQVSRRPILPAAPRAASRATPASLGGGPRAGWIVAAGWLALASAVLVYYAQGDGPRSALVVACAALTLVLGLIRVGSSVRALERLVGRGADADIDAVSGLLNRRALGEALDWACERGPGAVLLIDVDRFREVNQYLGQRAADEVLRQLGERLAAVATDAEILGRLGADEFVLISPNVGVAEAMVRARQVRSLTQFAFTLGADAVRLDLSIGVALWSAGSAMGETLLSHAHDARRLARERASGIERWDPERDVLGARRLAFADSLRRSVRDEELQLSYQPKVDTRRAQVVGVEALARWRHEGEVVPPELFLAVAEEAGLITELTSSLIDQALAQLARWDEAGLHLSMAVNVSPRALSDPVLARRVARALQRCGVAPNRLVLEIAETALIPDQRRVSSALQRLRQLGVGLCIDDYGTGHVSLSYLRDFAMDELKLDRSSVTLMVEDERARAVVRSTVFLGGQLGLDVVAQGVERPDQLDALTACGCHLIQGDLLCAPLPAEELTAWLAGGLGRGPTGSVFGCPGGAGNSLDGLLVEGVGAMEGGSSHQLRP